jgi:hypothetical protein
MKLLDRLRVEAIHNDSDGYESGEGEDVEDGDEGGGVGGNRTRNRGGGGGGGGARRKMGKSEEEEAYIKKQQKQLRRSQLLQQKRADEQAQMEEVKSRVLKANQLKKERSSDLYVQGGKGHIKKGGKKQDPIEKLEEIAIDELSKEQRQKAARIRRMKELHLKRQKVRSANLRRHERQSEIKKQGMWDDLERVERSRKMKCDYDNKRSVEKLLKVVLKQLTREVYEDNLMDSDHLRVSIFIHMCEYY